MLKGHSVPGVVTGKPIAISGVPGRISATGRGVTFSAKNILREKGIPFENTTIVVQGFGNVGSTAARLFHKEGFKVISVSDVSGGLYCKDGLDIPELLEYTKVRGRFFKDYTREGVAHITNKEVLSLACTILVPAALENQINSQTAADVKAQIIVEAANGPTTLDGDKILAEKDITVLPDVLCNAGGVIVSYLEWVQNIQSMYWDEEEINGKMKRVIDRAFQEVMSMSKEKEISLRDAAYLIAVRRIVEAKKIRRTWP